MSSYTDLADWYEPAGGILFRVVRPVEWEIGRKGSGLWVIVPLNYVFDVSIPALLRWAFDPRDPRYLKAAALFSDALKADGVGFFRRLAMVLAVVVYKFR
jgi:hypothetical protein